ncbi:MAG: hypothetical protein JXR69_00935 [Candidatus Delongbacteria bacterium]|nr:hypothetical protein [Candidatus Delongbacteria bacterium]
MKSFLQMYKYIFRSTPKVTISFLIMIVSTTIYKIFFLKHGGLYSLESITIANIIFRIVFTLFIIGSYGMFFGLMRGVITTSNFLLIPKIRKKALSFTFVNLLGIYTCGILISSFDDPRSVLFFTMLNLWFLSFCMSLYFIDITSVYRSNKYLILKIFFFLFSIAGPLVVVKDPFKRPVLFITIVSIFLIVVFYQIINFLNHYIRLDLNDDKTKHKLAKNLDSFNDFIADLTTGSYTSTVHQIKHIKLEKRYFKLFNITLMGPIGIYPWLAIGALSSTAYIHFIREWSLNTFL